MNPNLCEWRHQKGHYEVWYLTLTDRESRVGFWIRYTMVAPINGEASCSLWFLAMDPEQGVFGAKHTLPIEQFEASSEPFSVNVGGAALSDYGATGSFENDGKEVKWELGWQPRLPAQSHVHPLLRKVKLAKTIVVVQHPDIELSGQITFDGRTLPIDRARGDQTHLWGSKHANRWVWAHCNDFDGVDNTYFDGISVYVPRFGREIGPNTPILLRVDGSDFNSINPVAVMRNSSDFGLDSWSFETKGLLKKAVGEIRARPTEMAGVTYHDPDGELVYCYNTEIADMDLDVFERGSPRKKWTQVAEFKSRGSTHFEYAQRQPVTAVELKTT